MLSLILWLCFIEFLGGSFCGRHMGRGIVWFLYSKFGGVSIVNLYFKICILITVLSPFTVLSCDSTVGDFRYVEFIDLEVFRLLPNLPDWQKFFNLIITKESLLWVLGLSLVFFNESLPQKNSTTDSAQEADDKVQPTPDSGIKVANPSPAGEATIPEITIPDSKGDLIHLEPTPDAKKSAGETILEDVKDLIKWVGTKIRELLDVKEDLREFFWGFLLESAYLILVAYSLDAHLYALEFYNNISFVMWVRGVDLNFFINLVFDFFQRVWMLAFICSMCTYEIKQFINWIRLTLRKFLDLTIYLRQIAWSTLLEIVYICLIAYTLDIHYSFLNLFVSFLSLSGDMKMVLELFCLLSVGLMICSIFVEQIKDCFHFIIIKLYKCFGLTTSLQQLIWVALKLLVKEALYFYMVFLVVDSWQAVYVKFICLYLEIFFFKVSTLFKVAAGDPQFLLEVFLEVFGWSGFIFVFGGFLITTFLLLVCVLLCRYHVKTLLKLFKSAFINK